MAQAQAIAVSPSALPGDTQRSGGTAPAPAAPVAAPAVATPEHTAPVQETQAPAPAVDPALAEILNVPAQRQPAQQAPAPAAVQPSAPSQAGSDPVIDALSGVITSAGLDYERALGRALEEQDPSLIDYRYIDEVGGEAAAQLRKAAEAIVAQQAQKVAQLEAAVYAQYGGQAQWEAALQFYANSVSEPELEYVCGMLESLDPVLVDRAAKFILQFVKLNGGVYSPANPLQPGGATGPGAGALSKEQFKAEVRKLDPRARDYNQKYQELHERRKAGIARGL